MMEKQKVQWPQKYNLFGVNVSSTTYEDALNQIIYAANNDIPAIISHLPVHGLIMTNNDPSFKTMINSFNIVAPDGQPVRWALNLLHGIKLTDRVYGPEMMLRLCHRAAEMGIGVYLYGSYQQVVEKLRSKLIEQYPLLQVVGFESPPFRPLTVEEDKAVVDRINNSGASLVFLGLGCPKQEVFAYEHQQRIKAVQICVGAAFDFHSGEKKMAPMWMQRNGLEWLFRMVQEPRRLWRRYLLTNSVFLFLLTKRLLKHND